MEVTGDPFVFDDPAAALDALARWDELAPATLERLASDAVHGPQLETLQRAEGWLRDQASAGRPDGPAGKEASTSHCPPADELYDYGRGPGHAPLAAERRARIDDHLLHCLECELLIESLAQRPPLPLVIEPPAEDDELAATALSGTNPAGTAETTPATGGRLLRFRRLVPALVAASLLALLPLWSGLWGEQSVQAEGLGLGLPTAPLLRGEAPGALLFPRERMLAMPRTAALPAWLDLSSLRRFEIDPLETDADCEYRVELYGHFGGAFEEGRRLARHTGDSPVIEVANVLGSPLPVGHYTWDAWAIVDGLDRRLGARDFEVVEDEGLWAALLEELGDTIDRPDATRLAAAVRRLHEAGFVTDARALARELPRSVERDEYIGRRPGR